MKVFKNADARRQHRKRQHKEETEKTAQVTETVTQE